MTRFLFTALLLIVGVSMVTVAAFVAYRVLVQLSENVR